jgi:hypothetical protein
VVSDPATDQLGPPRCRCVVVGGRHEGCDHLDRRRQLLPRHHPRLITPVYEFGCRLVDRRYPLQQRPSRFHLAKIEQDARQVI